MRCSRAGGGGEGEVPCSGGGYLAFFARTEFEAPVVPPGLRLFVKPSAATIERKSSPFGTHVALRRDDRLTVLG